MEGENQLLIDKRKLNIEESINYETLKLIQRDLGIAIADQREPLNRIEDNLMRTQIHLTTAEKNILEAKTLNTRAKKVIAGGLLGAAMLTPVGYYVGLKVGIYCIVGGAAFGSAATRSIIS